MRDCKNAFLNTHTTNYHHEQQQQKQNRKDDYWKSE